MAEENAPRITDRAERNAATSFRDNAGGPPTAQRAVTDRPNDLVKDKVTNTTFGQRAKARGGAKSVDSADVEDKAVSSSRTSTKAK